MRHISMSVCNGPSIPAKTVICVGGVTELSKMPTVSLLERLMTVSRSL